MITLAQTLIDRLTPVDGPLDFIITETLRRRQADDMRRRDAQPIGTPGHALAQDAVDAGTRALTIAETVAPIAPDRRARMMVARLLKTARFENRRGGILTTFQLETWNHAQIAYKLLLDHEER